MTVFYQFFIDHFASPKEILTVGPVMLVWSALCLYLSGYLKQSLGLKTGYTRKVFHFLIFTSSFVIQANYGLTMLCLFGACTSVVILFALIKGDGYVMYEAMAREKDAPRRSFYIIVPYLSTLIGGVMANVWFAEFAIIGYLVTGLGDAIAEPVGTKFGKHRYRVLTLSGGTSERSWEGSLAVASASYLAILISWHILGLGLDWNAMLWMAAMLALACAVIEALSPHGLDNLSLQVIPPALSFWFLPL